MSNNIFDSAINVTQFGWDEFDKSGVGLIQDYIAQAQKLRDECVASLEGIQQIIDGLPDIDNAFEYIQVAYEDFKVKYPTFERDYEQFTIQYAQVQQMYSFIVDAKNDFDEGKEYIESVVIQVHEYLRQSREALAQIQLYWNQIIAVRAEVLVLRDECKDYAEEVRLGKVYRGLWNPQVAQAYPTTPVTNSIWDIVLNEGTSEFDWSGVKWKAGNSLIYMLDTKAFAQAVNPSAGVDSFNGRRGAILPQVGDYTPALVGADPAGTALTTVTSAIQSLKEESDPFNHYPLKVQMEDYAVTSFNGKTGPVTGEEAWTVIHMDVTSPDISTVAGRVVFLADTTGGLIEVNLNNNITELYVKDVGGACRENPLTINAAPRYPINGESTETIDENFGYVHYLLVNGNLVTIGGA